MEASDIIPGDWREWRRLRALHLKQQGWCQRDSAAALGVADETVSRWLARTRDGGGAALRARAAPGRPPKLWPAQKRQIPEFLWRGPEAYGFRGAVWTRARVARVIREEFGIRYHPTHVGRLLRELRGTPPTGTPGTKAAGSTASTSRCVTGRAWTWRSCTRSFTWPSAAFDRSDMYLFSDPLTT